MTLRKFLLLGIAISGLTGLVADEAMAAKPFFLFRPFLPGYNDSYPPPDDVYYMDEEDYYRYLKRQRRKQRILQEYYDSQDQVYYEEDYVPPRKAKKKQTVKSEAKKPVTRTAKAKKPSAPKGVVASTSNKAAEETTASVSKVAPAPKGTAASVTCSKAADIVAGYGFDSVKAGTCSGSVYSFNAVRSGKSYVVKVNSVSGELTEVRKL